MEWDYEELKSSMKELQRVKAENTSLKRIIAELRMTEMEKKMLDKELLELKCVLADQEDEIIKLTEHTQQLSESYDTRQHGNHLIHV